MEVSDDGRAGGRRAAGERMHLETVAVDHVRRERAKGALELAQLARHRDSGDRELATECQEARPALAETRNRVGEREHAGRHAERGQSSAERTRRPEEHME